MSIIKFENIENVIVNIRGEKVLIDQDVANIYGVETKRINEAVKNNSDKFPEDYCYKTTDEELEILRSKFSTAKFAKTRTTPSVFTEKGLYMLATILKSKKATEATFAIIETFAKIKELSRNINSIIKTSDEALQKNLAKKSNHILEQIIDIDEEVMDDEAGEIIETTTKFEFNLGFAKISRSVKKVSK